MIREPAPAAKGIWVVITNAGINRLLLPEFADDDSPERTATLSMSATGDLVADFAWAQVMRKDGVPIVLASDAGVRFTPLRRFDESVHCGIETLGVTASEAIGLATLKAADALGISAEVGSIDVGRRADLVVLAGHVTDTTRRLGDIRQVWRDGRVVVDDSRIIFD